jgi:hypothetical protein
MSAGLLWQQWAFAESELYSAKANLERAQLASSENGTTPKQKRRSDAHLDSARDDLDDVRIWLIAIHSVALGMNITLYVGALLWNNARVRRRWDLGPPSASD